jgi:hypothetical protein
VVVSAAKIGLLRSALGCDADRVAFADMADVGANPARIIPAWRDFVAGNDLDRRRARGIGEPIWAGRSPAELVECQRHEPPEQPTQLGLRPGIAGGAVVRVHLYLR